MPSQRDKMVQELHRQRLRERKLQEDAVNVKRKIASLEEKLCAIPEEKKIDIRPWAPAAKEQYYVISATGIVWSFTSDYKRDPVADGDYNYFRTRPEAESVAKHVRLAARKKQIQIALYGIDGYTPKVGERCWWLRAKGGFFQGATFREGQYWSPSAVPFKTEEDVRRAAVQLESEGLLPVGQYKP